MSEHTNPEPYDPTTALRSALSAYDAARPDGADCPVCGKSECGDTPHGLDQEDENRAIDERGRLVGLLDSFAGGCKSGVASTP